MLDADSRIKTYKMNTDTECPCAVRLPSLSNPFDLGDDSASLSNMINSLEGRMTILAARLIEKQRGGTPKHAEMKARQAAKREARRNERIRNKKH